MGDDIGEGRVGDLADGRIDQILRNVEAGHPGQFKQYFFMTMNFPRN
jgi:hypothetical protein